MGVRVRPFLPKIDGEDICCVTMTDTETKITDLLEDKKEKKFTFDYSFWTFDGYEPVPHEGVKESDWYNKPKAGSEYKDQ